MRYAVIMAGGSGTRFWPLSRQSKPKQLLSIVGDRTMIQATFDRLLPIVPAERIVIVTGASHAEEIRLQLPDIPPENILIEPVGRNTAACIALAAMVIAKRDPEAVMGVFPADHTMTKQYAFIESVKGLFAQIENDPSKIATMGITPSYAETGYGYIRRGEETTPGIFGVREFCEKPDTETAEKYISSGEYYWNSGMFFWNAQTICGLLRKYKPELMEAMAPIEKSVDTSDFYDMVEKVYPELESISIDYAVMEKAGGEGLALVAAADPGWNDVGSWRSLYDLMAPDEAGNRSRGVTVAVDTTGALVHSDRRVVALVGLNDVMVVETDDAILVCHKDRAQDVRKVIESLREMGLTRHL